MKDYKQILNELPNSWETFTLRQYKKTLDIKISYSTNYIDVIFDGANNTVKLLSALTDIDKEYFENLPMNQFKEIGQRISFVNTEPIPAKKLPFKCKPIDKITYNTYILYMAQPENRLMNITELIKGTITEELTVEQIEDLSMTEVWGFFLLLKKHVNKYIKRTIRYTALKLIKVSLMNLFKMPLTMIGKRKKH